MITLVRFQGTPKDVAALAPRLEEVFPRLRVALAPKPLPLPARAFYEAREQFLTHALLQALAAEPPPAGAAEAPVARLGIAAHDLFATGQSRLPAC